MQKQIKKAIGRVDPEYTYNATEMHQNKFFPWFSDRKTYTREIFDDLTNEDLLKAKITGKGRGRDYKIIGKNIIKYLESKL